MFAKLSETVYASPQIGPEEVKQAADSGFALIINNRPEGEAPDQTPGVEIEAAAKAAGLAYVAIPVGHGGFSEAQVSAMAHALESSSGPILAYCRSGTRSTLLWSLAQASRGVAPDELVQAALAAGYDLSPVRALLEMLAAK